MTNHTLLSSKSLTTCLLLSVFGLITADGFSQYTNTRARTAQIQAQQARQAQAARMKARNASAGYALSRVSGPGSTATGASLSGLKTALAGFSSDVGRAPTTAEGLNALIYPPPGVRNWKGPYVAVTSRTPFVDPWGNPYRYASTPNGRYTITTISSDGPDRRQNTTDDLFIRF